MAYYAIEVCVVMLLLVPYLASFWVVNVSNEEWKVSTECLSLDRYNLPSAAQATTTSSGSPPPEQSRFDVLASILTDLDFHQLAVAVPSLSNTSYSVWNGPYTIFAHSDDSIRSCASCSVSQLLAEHMVPGLYSSECLQKLDFGTKIVTMNTGRCLTITGTGSSSSSRPEEEEGKNKKLFVNGVEITRSNLFYNGLVRIHGLEGDIVSHISPHSCSIHSPFLPQLTPPEDNDKKQFITKEDSEEERSQRRTGYLGIVLCTLFLYCCGSCLPCDRNRDRDREHR